MSQPADDKPQRIRQQLERILQGATFAGSERHRAFLRFLVEQSLSGQTDKLNEFVLGFEVFNKNESFDPRIDSIVRVEARRLRERLKKYYQEEGASDPIIITIRPRSFVPEFEETVAADTPECPTPAARRHLTRRTRWVALGLGALLLLALAVGGVVLGRRRVASPPQTVSVIVLPFQVLTPVSGDEPAGERLADSLISGLTGIPGLRVISRVSAMQFQASGRAPFEFAAELKVDYIVEGTIRSADGRISVSAKMTDTHTQSYVWAETRDCAAGDLGDLERRLTMGIAGHVHLPLPPEPAGRAARRRAAPEAYGAFLKGQYYWYEWDAGSVEKSIELFQKAISIDASYAPAWAWLSQSYLLVILREEGRNPTTLAKGREAAQRALALDDQLAEAHAASASYAALERNWLDADRGYRRAIQLNRDWAQGHLMYALLCLLPNGQLHQALGETLQAHELDPLTRTTRAILAEMFYFNKDYARAVAESADLRKPGAGPSPGDHAYYLSLSLSGRGQRALSEARAEMADAPDDSPAAFILGYLEARHGERSRAQAILARLQSRSKTVYISPMALAMVCIGLGDEEQTLSLLRQAVKARIPGAVNIGVDPVFEPLRGQRAFAEIVGQMNLKPAD